MHTNNPLHLTSHQLKESMLCIFYNCRDTKIPLVDIYSILTLLHLPKWFLLQLQTRRLQNIYHINVTNTSIIIINLVSVKVKQWILPSISAKLNSLPFRNHLVYREHQHSSLLYFLKNQLTNLVFLHKLFALIFPLYGNSHFHL